MTPPTDQGTSTPAREKPPQRFWLAWICLAIAFASALIALKLGERVGAGLPTALFAVLGGFACGLAFDDGSRPV